jgi:hypothetical protein
MRKAASTAFENPGDMSKKAAAKGRK